MMQPQGEERARLRLQATYLGTRLDVRGLEGFEAVAWSPLVLRVGARGYAVLFRHGIVVTIDLVPEEEDALIADLRARVSDPFPGPERDEAAVVVDPREEERIDHLGVLWLREADPRRLQVVAEALAKSTALGHYEAELNRALDQIEPLTERVRSGRRAVAGQRDLLIRLGNALVSQVRVIGRLGVEEKPDVTWDEPALDRLYERLASEYELAERNRILSRKMDFLSDSIGVLIGMAQHRQSVRLEWYIVLLIFIEIVLSLIDRFFR